MPSPARIYHPDGLAAAKACAIPGLCLFCESELAALRVPGRPRIMCGEHECMLAYWRAWKKDQRAGAGRGVPLAFVRHHCGCGRSYCGEYFRRFHLPRCLFAAQAWPVVVVPARAAA